MHRVLRPPINLVDFYKEGAVVDGLTGGDMDGPDRPRPPRLDLVLHLHRFHDQKPVPGRDLVPRRDVDL